jgi:hypothetical protein
MDYRSIDGSGQALPGRFHMWRFSRSPLAALLSGRFAAETPVTGCDHEEKAT